MPVAARTPICTKCLVFIMVVVFGCGKQRLLGLPLCQRPRKTGVFRSPWYMKINSRLFIVLRRLLLPLLAWCCTAYSVWEDTFVLQPWSILQGDLAAVYTHSVLTANCTMDPSVAVETRKATCLQCKRRKVSPRQGPSHPR